MPGERDRALKRRFRATATNGGAVERASERAGAPSPAGGATPRPLLRPPLGCMLVCDHIALRSTIKKKKKREFYARVSKSLHKNHAPRESRARRREP